MGCPTSQVFRKSCAADHPIESLEVERTLKTKGVESIVGKFILSDTHAHRIEEGLAGLIERHIVAQTDFKFFEQHNTAAEVPCRRQIFTFKHRICVIGQAFQSPFLIIHRKRKMRSGVSIEADTRKGQTVLHIHRNIQRSIRLVDIRFSFLRNGKFALIVNNCAVEVQTEKEVEVQLRSRRTNRHHYRRSADFRPIHHSTSSTRGCNRPSHPVSVRRRWQKASW